MLSSETYVNSSASVEYAVVTGISVTIGSTVLTGNAVVVVSVTSKQNGSLIFAYMKLYSRKIIMNIEVN